MLVHISVWFTLNREFSASGPECSGVTAWIIKLNPNFYLCYCAITQSFHVQLGNCSCAAGWITHTFLMPSHNFNTLTHAYISCLDKAAFPCEQSPLVSVSQPGFTLFDISPFLYTICAFLNTHTHTHACVRTHTRSTYQPVVTGII